MKNNLIKKLISIVAVSAMTASLLAGCGAQEAAAPAAEPAATEEPAAEEPAPAEEKPAKRFLLFTTRTCPNCAIIKEFLAEQGTEYELLLAEENRELARSLGIMQAPTAVIIDGDNVEKYIGVSKIKNYVLNAQ